MDDQCPYIYIIVYCAIERDSHDFSEIWHLFQQVPILPTMMYSFNFITNDKFKANVLEKQLIELSYFYTYTV